MKIRLLIERIMLIISGIFIFPLMFLIDGKEDTLTFFKDMWQHGF